MSPRATMSAERLLSIIGVWFACISPAKIYLRDFVAAKSLLRYFITEC